MQARIGAGVIAALLCAAGATAQASESETVAQRAVVKELFDGTFASIWVDYSLYVGTRFIHCGVDVFHVAQVGDAWKIVALTDTRRQTGCTK